MDIENELREIKQHLAALIRSQPGTWLSIKQAAKHIATGDDFIRAAIADGSLPATNLSGVSGTGARWRVRLSDLEKFMSQGR